MVEEVFGCRYFSCYGQSEKVALAAGCEKSDDYHVWPTYGYFELLNERGDPVTTPGERGEHDDTFIHVREYQFLQEMPGQATLRGVRVQGFDDEDARRICQNLGRKVDGQLCFTIALVDNISLSVRGKAVYVDQRIPREHRN